jgi:hypothetical protein
MKKLLVLTLTLASFNLFAFNTALSTSKAKLQITLASLEIESTSKIEAININDRSVTVLTKDFDDKCFAQSVSFELDGQGNPTILEDIPSPAQEVDCQ